MEATNPPSGQNRRKQYFIDKPFQKRMILNLVALVIGGILVAHAIALGFVKLAQISENAPAAPSGADVAQGTGMVVQLLSSLWIPIMITVILMIVFALIFGLLYSHRIAGPMFNLKRMMNRVENGSLNITMHIREKDEFHDIEHVFNQMVAGLNERLHKIQAVAAELPPPAKGKMESAIRQYFEVREEQPGKNTF